MRIAVPWLKIEAICVLQMKRKYVAATSTLSERRKFSIPERRDRVSARIDHDDIRFLAEFEIDLMLAKMRSMTPQEAAVAAAQAVAEAEAAMAEAEEAVREAEAAEADAEAAEAYAEAALQTLRRRKTRKMVRYLLPRKFFYCLL